MGGIGEAARWRTGSFGVTPALSMLSLGGYRIVLVAKLVAKIKENYLALQDKLVDDFPEIVIGAHFS